GVRGRASRKDIENRIVQSPAGSGNRDADGGRPCAKRFPKSLRCDFTPGTGRSIEPIQSRRRLRPRSTELDENLLDAQAIRGALPSPVSQSDNESSRDQTGMPITSESPIHHG